MSKVSPTLGDMLESYFHRRLITQQRASIETIRGYRDALRLLVIFIAEQLQTAPERLSIQDLDRDVILAFLDHLEDFRHNCVRTRNNRLAAIRAFMQYVAYMDPGALGVVQRVLAIPNKKYVKPILGYLTCEELDVLLNVPDQTTRQGRRDHALLLFLARTGARVSEAVRVNAVDICLNSPCQVLLHGKGMRDRSTPVATDLVAALGSLYEELRITVCVQSPPPCPSPVSERYYLKS
ncbi:MAG: tyrosine-type recombinase/integrase [Armatimonadota bacterium]